MLNRHIGHAVHAVLCREFEAREGAEGGLPAPRAGGDIKTMEDLKTEFLNMHKQLREFIEKANVEIKASGTATTETKAALTALSEGINTLGVRLDKIEAKGNRIGEGEEERPTAGTKFIELPDFKELGTGKIGKCRMELLGKDSALMDTRAIVNATGQNQPLVPDMRLPGIINMPNRRLRIRELIPTGRTTSNLVQYVKENVFTNNAGPQAGGSPTVAAENTTKPESDITFVLANAPVVTLAHFILVSRQVLDDAPMLESYINGRLLYGLALEEEDEILNGDGTVGTLDGLMHNATAFNRSNAGTKLDILRRARTQLELSELIPEFIVLNPTDWEDIELTKDANGRYIIANPQSLLGPQLWGLPVVATNSMTAGQFLVGNGSMAAQLWDRQSAAVELSREDSDNFRKNMVTLLAEERLALTIFRSQALIKGVFP